MWEPFFYSLEEPLSCDRSKAEYLRSALFHKLHRYSHSIDVLIYFSRKLFFYSLV